MRIQPRLLRISANILRASPFTASTILSISSTSLRRWPARSSTLRIVSEQFGQTAQQAGGHSVLSRGCSGYYGYRNQSNQERV
jgi:hypothetical protein